MLNPKAEAVKEEIAVGLRQAEVVAHLKQVAAETGHALGVYYTVADGQRCGRRAAAAAAGNVPSAARTSIPS